MKSNLLIALGLSLLVFSKAHAKIQPTVVYGDDNRLDMYDVTNDLHKQLALSTAAMIPSSSLVKDGETISIKAGTLEGDGMCSTERFAKQPTAAMCSGFLVGSKYLITAGHCITSDADCSSNSWVFDYAVNTEKASATTVKTSNVYSCAKIISRTQDRSTMNDFALIELDRAVDRKPLTFRKSGKVDLNTEIVVIGHPSGLPTKVSAGAFVRSNDNKYYFQANLDTFGGNSGSAVFDAKTGVVEGILVRGETDYTYDSTAGCYKTKKCQMNECRGEDVTRITQVKGLDKI